MEAQTQIIHNVDGVQYVVDLTIYAEPITNHIGTDCGTCSELDVEVTSFDIDMITTEEGDIVRSREIEKRIERELDLYEFSSLEFDPEIDTFNSILFTLSTLIIFASWAI